MSRVLDIRLIHCPDVRLIKPDDLPRTDFSLSTPTETTGRLIVDFLFSDQQIPEQQDLEKTSLLSPAPRSIIIRKLMISLITL